MLNLETALNISALKMRQTTRVHVFTYKTAHLFNSRNFFHERWKR